MPMHGFILYKRMARMMYVEVADFNAYPDTIVLIFKLMDNATRFADGNGSL
jgi:hypothetical protein